THSLRALLSSLTTTPTSALSTLSLHDALPIFGLRADRRALGGHPPAQLDVVLDDPVQDDVNPFVGVGMRMGVALGHAPVRRPARSEEHTSELQSHLNLVCRLLLEKKKKYNN